MNPRANNSGGGLLPGSVAATLVLFLPLLFCRGVDAELGEWSIGGGRLNWRSTARNFAAIDFGVAGAIQLAGFEPDANIVGALDWADGIPSEGYIPEHSQANIWNNYPIKFTDLVIVDGDPDTSTENRFKRFGASQEGINFQLDLGSRFPLQRIVFFPRLEGGDEGGNLYRDDFIRAYALKISDGLNFDEDRRPVYETARRVEFTREEIADVTFPLQFIRFVRLEILAPNPFELAEIQLFGNGFVPRGEYLSEVIDMGRLVNFRGLGWKATGLRRAPTGLEEVSDSKTRLSIQVRSGLDDSPQRYFQLINRFSGERLEVTEAEWQSLAEADQIAEPEEDQENWSLWSARFTAPVDKIDLPSPRRYFQFRAVMESSAILDGVRLDTLAVQFSAPPLARSLFGEISLLEDPEPPRRYAVVPAGVASRFAYDVAADLAFEDEGFDALRIFTPAGSQFVELLTGDPPLTVIPDSVDVRADALTLFFPSNVVDRSSSGILRVIFDARVLLQATTFAGEVFSTEDQNVTQPVLPGNANQLVRTDRLRVLTSAATARRVLSSLEVAEVFSPNGDGVNDQGAIRYDLVQLLVDVPTKVEIFDLTGRRVRSLVDGPAGTGTYELEWDGRDQSGAMSPPGIYVIRLSVRTNEESFLRTRTMALVY